MKKLCLMLVRAMVISTILLPAISAKAIDVTDNKLVACWFFDEGKGESVKDSSQNALDGKIWGDVEWSDKGKYNSCLKFPGNPESYVEVPHSELLNLKEFTISVWIKSEFTGDYQSIVVKSDGTLESRQYTLYTRDGTGVLHTDLHAGGNRCKTYGSIEVCDGQWHHLALSFDGKTQILYVDGEKDTGEQAEAECSGELVKAESSLTIGRDSPNGGYPMQGMLDEVALFEKALKQKEIEELTNGISLAVNPKDCLSIFWGKLKQE